MVNNISIDLAVVRVEGVCLSIHTLFQLSEARVLLGKPMCSCQAQNKCLPRVVLVDVLVGKVDEPCSVTICFMLYYLDMRGLSFCASANVCEEA